MMSPLLLFLTAAFIVYCVWLFAIYPTFFSPLSKIPSAHFSSSFSPLWILFKRYTESENRAIHAAHVKHGPLVRLGPNEISVNSVDDGIRIVYGGGFEKWAWYDNLFRNYNVPCMFSMVDSKPHSIRKRVVSNVYSKSYVQSSPDLRRISRTIILDRFLPLLDDAANHGKPVEMLEIHQSIAMDFIMSYIFGLSNGTNFLQDAKFRQYWQHTYRSRRPYRFLYGELPSLSSCMSKLGWFAGELRKAASATEELENWALKHCEGAAKSFKSGTNDIESDTKPIVYAELAASLPNDPAQAPFPKHLQIATEVFDHLAAGQETTGIALTYLFHELSCHPSLQAKLRTELLSLSPTLQYSPDATASRDLPSSRDLDCLPFLHALILETLRIHASIPGPQPRITPSTPTKIASSPLPLPPGVRVSAQPYSLHRNPNVFPDPEEWKPERWLPNTSASGHQQTDSTNGAASEAKAKADEEHRAEMHRWFWAFGSGGRMCIGRHFALQEMKLITASVYTNFSTYIVDDKGIEQEDAYTAGPQSNQLFLGFRRW